MGKIFLINYNTHYAQKRLNARSHKRDVLSNQMKRSCGRVWEKCVSDKLSMRSIQKVVHYSLNAQTHLYALNQPAIQSFNSFTNFEFESHTNRLLGVQQMNSPCYPSFSLSHSFIVPVCSKGKLKERNLQNTGDTHPLSLALEIHSFLYMKCLHTITH